MVPSEQGDAVSGNLWHRLGGDAERQLADAVERAEGTPCVAAEGDDSLRLENSNRLGEPVAAVLLNRPLNGRDHRSRLHAEDCVRQVNVARLEARNLQERQQIPIGRIVARQP